MAKKIRRTPPLRKYLVGVLQKHRLVVTITATSRAKAQKLARAGFGDARPAEKPQERRSFIKRVA